MLVAGGLRMQSKRFERGNPELRRMQSKRFERGDPELLAKASRMEAAKVALSTFKSVQPHAMERAEVHGTSFSSQGMGDAMNAAVRRRGQHSGHRAHAAHKCCAQQRACIRAMSGGISRGHDRPGRAKHALTPKREEGQDGTLLWHVSGHSCGMYHVCGIKFLVQRYGLNWAVDHVAFHTPWWAVLVMFLNLSQSCVGSNLWVTTKSRRGT